jgi:hypothetical protein
MLPYGVLPAGPLVIAIDVLAKAACSTGLSKPIAPATTVARNFLDNSKRCKSDDVTRMPISPRCACMIFPLEESTCELACRAGRYAWRAEAC